MLYRFDYLPSVKGFRLSICEVRMKRLSLWSFAIAFLALVIFGIQGANAQANFGSINGTVTDPSGAAVPNAEVTVTSKATGIARTTHTNASGFYSVGALTADDYTVQVTASGFQSSITENLHLTPGLTLANNVKLEVGQVSAKVVVSANTVQVNTQTSGTGGVISSEQIKGLMLNGRNFQSLAITVPGVSSTAHADSMVSGGLLAATTLIVNGQSAETTTYTIDGMYNMNSGNMANLNIFPIVDAISQYTVLTANYSAQYGFAGSGQVIVQTMAGGNQYHGSAWDYLRNDAIDANNYFSTTKQSLRQNIYGYTLGGPVVIPHIYGQNGPHKLFFFASNQWYSIAAGQVRRAATFPEAMRNGDFSNSPTLPASKTLTLDPHSQALLAATGRTNCLSGPTTINPSCFDPVAKGMIADYMPMPNNVAGGFLNYTNSGPQTTSQIDFVDRVDYNLNSSNLITARTMYENVKNGFPFDAWGGSPFPNMTDSYYQSAWNGMLRWTSNFTPTVMNTVTVGNTYDQVRIKNNVGGQMPSGVSITQAFPGADTLNRAPSVSISGGWPGLGPGTQPITASDGEGIAQDDLSWVVGKHVLQGGLLYMFGIKRQNVFTTPQGTFTFSGVHTGDPAADFLLGLNSTYHQASTQRFGNFHYREGDAYVQDDWRIIPDLTLNLGVRWVYFSNDTVSGSQLTSFIPARYDPTQAPVVNVDGTFALNGLNQPVTAAGAPANLLNGLVQAGTNGLPHGGFDARKTNFGPRIGFAYNVLGRNTTTIRGGYGIGYNRVPLEQVYDAFGQNPPFNRSANVLNSLLVDGTAGVAAAPTPQSLSNLPLSFVPSMIQSFSLTVQRQIIPNMVGTVGYVGSLGRNLMVFQGGYDGNFPLPVSAPSTTDCLAPNQEPSSHYDFDPCINAGLASPNYTRPYKGYANMDDQYDHGSSNYNSLQTSLEYRTGPLQFTFGYTYSKALTTLAGTGAGTANQQGAVLQNSRNAHADYGPPSYDFPNDLSATWVYQIPLFKKSQPILKGVLGNWTFSGLLLHQSGFALTPGMSTATNGLARRPNQAHPYKKIGTLNEWFDTSAYVAPPFGFFGNSTNGSIRGPSYTSVNLGIYKSFPIYDRLNFQFRAEAFNVANHPNFESVSTGLGAANNGQVTTAGDPRILEFAAKLAF